MRTRLTILALLAALLLPASASALDLSIRTHLGPDLGYRYSSVAGHGMAFGIGGDVLLGPVGIGVRSEWTVDKVFKEKEERTLARTANWVHVGAALGFGVLELHLGAGPGIGWVRVPTTTERLPSWGMHEFAAAYLSTSEFLRLGIRMEFHQLWQPQYSDDMDVGVGIQLAFMFRIGGDD
ncbi:MAG: hypothetical protein GY898_12110 [Proteobacteria bacterium]|nr:hypothetical protein [Pseudomonadota bacterium]